jgi:hypothetical protein
MSRTPRTPLPKSGWQRANEAVGWREELEAALAAGFIDRPLGLLPFLSLHEHQRVVGYSRLVERVETVPGVIVEVGVSRGDSLLTMAMQEAVLHPHDRGVRVFGFDSGEGFPAISAQDGGPDARVHRVEGGFGSDDLLLHLGRAIEILEAQYAACRGAIELIVGDACETIPQFVARYDRDGAGDSSLAVKLLHLDADLYEPTMTALRHLAPLLVPGAIVVLDEWDWARDDYPGESRALREYFAGELPEIRRDRWPQPGGWFVVTPEIVRFVHDRV